jgi:dihydroorotate dehydrogenase electron transfer subunit
LSRYFKATIKENISLNSDHNLLSLIALDISKEPLPGQFYLLEVNRNCDPLLKRAFSLFRKMSDGFQILYRIRGKGTSILKNMKQGTIIDVLGPLGHPYPHPLSKQTPIVVAGGIGIASVFSVIESLSKDAYVFYGARSKDELFMLDELREKSRELVISTDDGSAGEKGTVIDVLNNFLSSRSSSQDSYSMYGCGPRPMLAEIARVAYSNNIKAYVSLEENMACGIGACLGCAVKVRNNKSKIISKKLTVLNSASQTLSSEHIYKKVCTDGPVFNVEEILW